MVPEINLLIQFRHENIIKYDEYFTDEMFLYIVMEYCEVKWRSESRLN